MMTLSWLRAAMVLLIAGLLAACNASGVRDQSGDDTGDLGALGQDSASDIYIDLAAAYLRNGQLGEALKNAKKAILIDPRSSNAHNTLGLIYQQLGQFDAAGVHLHKAVEYEPRNPYALNALGSFLCARGEYDEADSLFNRALQNPLYPTPWIALSNAGLCAEQSGRMAVAEGYFRKALQRNATFAPALLRMAQISYDGQNYLSARAYLQRHSQIAPHTAVSLWLGVQTETQLGDMDQVASYALLLRANFPDSEQVQLLNRAN